MGTEPPPPPQEWGSAGSPDAGSGPAALCFVTAPEERRDCSTVPDRDRVRPGPGAAPLRAPPARRPPPPHRTAPHRTAPAGPRARCGAGRAWAAGSVRGRRVPSAERGRFSPQLPDLPAPPRRGTSATRGAVTARRGADDGPRRYGPPGCPRERQWEAVELASAPGEAGLPVSLC